MSRALIDALNKLVAAQGSLASSQLSVAQRLALNEFAQQTGIVAQRPQGRGSLYVLINQVQLAQYLSILQPIQPEQIHTLPQRTANLALYRNSKSQAHQHDWHYVLIKAMTGQEVIWQHQQKTLPLTQLTHLAGCASLMIHSQDDWHSKQPLWLVENQALFDDLSWLPAEATGTVLYYAGHIHGVLLDWLAKQPRCSELILFADYDGVGLSNYVRLCERLQQQVQFWLMPNWQQKLQYMGNRELWLNNRPLFDSSVAKLNHLEAAKAVMPLIEAMRYSALALEQEAVFL
ncbi:MAG: hypothetical protein KDI39_02185 [Pseudomonadales bacterium]|nr:hypothetical protein [Pseudomonadales bacterium]